MYVEGCGPKIQHVCIYFESILIQNLFNIPIGVRITRLRSKGITSSHRFFDRFSSLEPIELFLLVSSRTNLIFCKI